jgi:hypothetical protein
VVSALTSRVETAGAGLEGVVDCDGVPLPHPLLASARTIDATARLRKRSRSRRSSTMRWFIGRHWALSQMSLR